MRQCIGMNFAINTIVWIWNWWGHMILSIEWKDSETTVIDVSWDVVLKDGNCGSYLKDWGLINVVLIMLLCVRCINCVAGDGGGTSLQSSYGVSKVKLNIIKKGWFWFKGELQDIYLEYIVVNVKSVIETSDMECYWGLIH